jgi:hypothetical protein
VLLSSVVREHTPTAITPFPATPKEPPPPSAAPAKPPSPPKEIIPFDQWLLSERNIKFALYTGGLLLVLAGIIFISVNWTKFQGLVKFALTVPNLLMCAAGFYIPA